jgi:TPR repeat protein
MGLMYREGRGVQQNYPEALKWFRKAADQGHANAQFKLAAMYQTGTGVPHNFTEAFKWFRKAAEGGEVAAQILVAEYYFNGWDVVPQDYAEALK